MLNCSFAKEGKMAGKDIIMLSQKELKRIHIIQKVIDGVIRQVDAAGILLLSTRQIRRIIKKVKAEGEKGIIHKSRGRNCSFCNLLFCKIVFLHERGKMLSRW